MATSVSLAVGSAVGPRSARPGQDGPGRVASCPKGDENRSGGTEVGGIAPACPHVIARLPEHFGSPAECRLRTDAVGIPPRPLSYYRTGDGEDHAVRLVAWRGRERAEHGGARRVRADRDRSSGVERHRVERTARCSSAVGMPAATGH
ncbi:hypothetical protein [Streptomyces sp. NPDC057418]|uniref:hypothetical protein n=1 Tax=unclassified Streptomyces TaxID=2593676 RepID=UPI00367736C0